MVEIGSIIPLVYARRETVNGVTYGGIRVNTNLLWSQILSLGGDQLFRGVFLVGEGDDRANSMELDPEQFALGNNLLGAYELFIDNPTDNDRGRVAIYYSRNGGRLQPNDHIAGTSANLDPGNFVNNPRNGPDVFSVAGANNAQGANFVFVSKPSTQTTFGVYSWIANGFGYRVNPSLRPQLSLSTRPAGTQVDVVCNLDENEQAMRIKGQAVLPTRSGITAGATNLGVGDVVNYQIQRQVSREDPFESINGVGSIGSEDINASVASRQVGFDEAISVGELYKIGSALAICSDRDEVAFISDDAAGTTDSGTTVNAEFTVVRAGQMTPVASAGPGAGGNASGTSQIFRVSRASFITEYPCEVLEIGLRSNLGINISGLTNTISAGYIYETMDEKACATALTQQSWPPDTVFNSEQVFAGQVSVRADRYSFFRVRYRRAGTDEAYTEIPQLFGAKSETQQPSYSYLRLEMPNEGRWEIQFEPITAWEIRSGVAAGALWVIDPRMPEDDVTGGGVTVRFNGYDITRNAETFSINWLNPLEVALEPDRQNQGQYTDNPVQSMADPWAKLAEAFVYDEVQTTVAGNPEWEVVYINTILPNPVPPQYDNLAILGMNIRASREFANLSQLSVYMNRGLGGFHDFPSVLRDLLTNDRFGTGAIISPQQIDEQSFTDATTWSTGRHYYFDGTLTDPVNIRQWGASTAKDFLLDLIIRNGRFALQPLLNFAGPEDITGLFTAGNILEDSFELVYFDQEQRQQPLVSVKWRQEQTTGDLDNRGLFPIVRELTIRESTAPVDAPQEQIDLSDFCTSEIQAIDRAKYECRFRRLSTHQVRFTTTADQAALDLGRCFRLSLETLSYDNPTNGYVARDGTITSWPELADGTHLVVTWDGTNYVEQTISVADGRTADISETVFSVADNIFQTQTYRVQSLSFNEEGNIEVEAVHWPTDAQGVSLLTAGWYDDDNWEIEGEI